jgi:hypothetical protein
MRRATIVLTALTLLPGIAAPRSHRKAQSGSSTPRPGSGISATSPATPRDADGTDGYVIAVLTSGWPTWTRGVPTVNEIAGWVSESLTQ